MNDIITSITYTGLPAAVAAEVEAAATRIKDRLIRTRKAIIETGRDLIEVKSKLEHGQFEHWLNSEFDMDVRTAQRLMRAAKWAEGKNDTVSHLGAKSIYLLSAPSTPESAQCQVLDDLEAGKPVNHREVCVVVQEVKYQEREAKKEKEQRETCAERKQRKAREEQWRRKEKEERQRIETAAMAVAREVADILVNKLSEDEIKKVDDALRDHNVTYIIWIEALLDARQSHSDDDTARRDQP